MIERDVALLVLLVDQHRMALRERAALGVLAGQPNGEALEQQRAEGERLSRRPVDPLAGLDRFSALVDKTLNRPVHVEALRHGRDLLADVLELRDCYPGIATARLLRIAARLEAGPPPVQPVGTV